MLSLAIGTVALGIFVGLTTSQMQVYLGGYFERSPRIIWLALILALLASMVTGIYVTNQPDRIERELHLTYVLNPETKKLIVDVRPFGEGFCARNAATFFTNFGERNTDVGELIDDMAAISPSLTETFGFTRKFFRDFTAYLIPYCLGHATADGLGRKVYRQEGSDWLGRASESIRGNANHLDSIMGDFTQNIFYEIQGPENTNVEFLLPRNSIMSLQVLNPFTSILRIKNNFVELKIGVQIDLEAGNAAFLRTYDLASHVLTERQINDAARREDVVMLRRYDVLVYYDATFSRFRYGYSTMKDHRDWVDSWFNLLERKFHWASPPLLVGQEQRRIFSKYWAPRRAATSRLRDDEIPRASGTEN